MSIPEGMKLPPGWAIAVLPDLIGVAGLLSDGDWVESKDQDPAGSVRLTQLADIGDGVWRDRSNRFLTLKKSRELRCTYLDDGDILVARMPDPLGRACVFPGSDQQCVTVVDVCIIRLGVGSANRFWLMNSINSPQFRLAISELQSGSTRKRISKKNLCTIPFPVPPLPEQSRIVEVIESHLTRLDAAVRTLQRVQANLKRYRASVLKAAVEGRLVPTEAELARREGRDYEPASKLLERILDERRRRWEEAELAKMRAKGKEPKSDKWKGKYKVPSRAQKLGLEALPEGWCWTTVEQLASYKPRSIQSGPFGSSLLHSEFRETGRLVIGIDNVQSGTFSLGANHRISEQKFKKLERFRARPGDVLITVMATIGRCCVVPEDIEPAIISKHVYRISPETDLVLPEYLLLALMGCPSVRMQIFGEAQGQTRPGLNGVIIKRLNIPLPPIPEQERILAEVDRLVSVEEDSVAVDIEASLMRCDRLRKSILKWAFEGKLVDQDPNDEPASVLLDRIKAEREASKRKTGRGKGKQLELAL